MIYVRSLLFNIYFPLWTAILSISASPLIFTNAKRSAIVGRIWANGVVFGLRYICGIRYEIRGQENLPPEPFIIASKHQSAWDTAIFLKILNAPAYILKKELLKIPFFGSYLKTMAMIPIDRDGGAKALKAMLADVKDRISQKRSVVIFPEGTRTVIGQKIAYQPGIAFIYKDVSVPVVPVALNSGAYWSRSGFLRKPGTIVLQYMPAIEAGLDRKAFTAKMESTIEEASEALLK